jgi:hypothetical protein
VEVFDWGLYRQRFTEINGSIEIPRDARPPILRSLLFSYRKYGDGVIVVIPYWFIGTAILAFGAVPWLRWRFTLRTLLVATTLVAAGLGLIVWMNHH